MTAKNKAKTSSRLWNLKVVHKKEVISSLFQSIESAMRCTRVNWRESGLHHLLVRIALASHLVQ